MAAATARGTSDACIVASSLSLAHWQTLRAVQPAHDTKLSIESRGGATGRARLNRRSALPELDGSTSAAREAMGDTAFRLACDAGAALSYQAAGDLACELITSARGSLGRRVRSADG
jgi:hypothetical protein